MPDRTNEDLVAAGLNPIRVRIEEVVRALPPAERDAAIAWMDAAIEGHDPTSLGILEMIFNGQMRIASVGDDGEPRFALTPIGTAYAEHLINETPDGRAMWAQLNGRMGAGPKKAQ